MKPPTHLRPLLSFYYNATSGPWAWLRRSISERSRRRHEQRENRLLKRYHYKILAAFDSAMRELQLPYWLDYGTLLGIVRDGGYVENDRDTDFGMYLHDYTPQIAECLQRHGFKHVMERVVDGGKTGRESVFSYHGVHADIFYYHVEGDKMSTLVAFPEEGMSYDEMLVQQGGMRVYRTTHPYMATQQRTYRDLSLSVPADEHSYLCSCYGEGYKIKDPNYNYISFKAPNREVLEDKRSIIIYA